MSPASALSTAVRARPRKARIFETRKRSISGPSRASAFSVWPGPLPALDAAGQRAGPRRGRRQRRRQHRERLAGPRSCAGGGTWSRIRSKSGSGPCAARRGSRRPSRRGPRRRGAGSRAGPSSASRATKRSKTSFSARSGSASGWSTLFRTTIGRRPESPAPCEHELGLRHRPLGGVDEQEHAVDHAEDALDLAAEVGVAGGVDDVDPVPLPLDACRLGEDGDAALALEVVRVERPLDRRLVLAERPRLA